MTDDLVQRLRKWDREMLGCKDMHEAADRIEALEAALREISKLHTTRDHGLKENLCIARDIARRALGEKP